MNESSRKNLLKWHGRLERRCLLNWMPDELYLKTLYYLEIGEKLNLKNPKTFNEKIQWLNLHNRKPIFSAMVDKFEAKKYAASVIGSEHIIPTIGIWDEFEKIDFRILPKQFVLKCTHDSGGLSICRDKDTFDFDAAKKKINKAMKANYYWHSREWPYKNVVPRIIAEPYIENRDGLGLVDFKFFCFGGKAKMLYISQGLENHKTARISFVDMQGNEMPFHRSDYKQMEQIFLPNNFPEMIVLAEKMAQSVESQFIRIDLYSVDTQIYFSEITFCPCAGRIPFEPKEWDLKLGDWIDLQSES